MSILIETCPKCGADLMNSVIATFPPIHRKECSQCGWSWESGPEKVIRKPFQPEADVLINHVDITPIENHSLTPSENLSTSFSQPACKTCGCNPANGGSGICNCTLGNMPITS